MPRKAKYTIEQLKKAVANSTSFRQVLLSLGLAPQGGNHYFIERKCKKNDIDTSHFTGQAHRKGISVYKRPVSEYLNNKQQIGSFRLKNRLLKEGFLLAKCSSCEESKWLGQPIPLELDHIDGNNQNNNLDNLRLLCPNCHALTDTYRGRNKN